MAAPVGTGTLTGALALRNRILIATTSNFPTGFPDVLKHYTATSGVVAVGSPAGTACIGMRHLGFDGVIAFDPAHYEDVTATAATPLVLDAQNLFGTPHLRDYVDERTDFDAVFSPTGQIPSGDTETLHAVIARCNEADHPKVITTLPIHQGWLSRDLRDGLITAIGRSACPVALVTVGQLDPIEHPEYIDGLTEVTQRAAPIIHRTDLAAVQVVPRGAAAAVIGTTPSLRHALPAGQFARRRKKKNKKAEPGIAVFVPGINEFRDVRTVEEWFGDLAPACELLNCCGRQLTDFTADTRAELAGHNVRHVLAIAEDMLKWPTEQRMHWLRNYRNDVQGAFEHLRLTTGRRDIEPYASCAVWNALTD